MIVLPSPENVVVVPDSGALAVPATAMCDRVWLSATSYLAEITGRLPATAPLAGTSVGVLVMASAVPTNAPIPSVTVAKATTAATRRDTDLRDMSGSPTSKTPTRASPGRLRDLLKALRPPEHTRLAPLCGIS